MIKLFCLGAPQIHQLPAATPVHLTPKAMALFVYLAVTRRSHSRDLLANLLWSEMNNAQARANLRYLLPELRAQLADYLLISPRNISFNPQQPYWLDVEQLQTTFTAPAECVDVEDLQTALDLYQGEFLAGFSVRNAPVFEEWLLYERERIHAQVVQGCYDLAARYWVQAEYANALATTRRLLNWEPWHEAGHRLQMQLLAATGRRAAALAQYALCRQILADELGATPEAATTALYEELYHSEREWGISDKVTSDKVTSDKVTVLPSTPARLDAANGLLPSQPVGQSIPHNLPELTTSFIGRASEVAELCTKVLSADCRLLTLAGEGGIGKTRLALAVAQRVLALEAGAGRSPNAQPAKSEGQKFPHGIWFIPLADLAQDGNLTDQLTDQLVMALAKTIGLSFSGNQPLLTQLLAQLRHQALFLLFDNAEQLLPTFADVLLPILQQSPHTTVLVTSRHVMNLQAEVVWRLAGLSLPSPVTPPALPLHELTKYSSVALFIERASRAQPDFQLTAENGPTIVALCRLVEGLPLAIELAASLTKQYTCTALYTALQQDYTLLAAAGAGGNARHHNIQAMLAYSWRLLTAAEAHLLASCAVFVGGFTRAAVLAITDVAPALLVNLIDQSLLQMRTGRFFMHALVRHYAAAQLAQVPQWQVYMAAAHAAYYIDLLHSLEGALVVDNEAQQHIQNEIENIRTAWAWSVAQAEVALLDKGVDTLQAFYHLTGLYREGLHLLTTALDMVKQTSFTGPTAVRVQSLQARLLCYSAQFYRRLGELQRCEQCANDALTLAHGLRDPALQGLAYHELARLAYVRGDFLLMNKLAEQGYTQALQTDQRHLTAECLNDLGLAVGMCQGPLAAAPHFHAALHLLQGGDNRFLQAFIFVNLGFFYLSYHQYQWACDHLQQGITIQQQFQIRGGSVMPLRYLGDLWLALGCYEAAQQQYEQVLTLLTTMYSHYAMSGFYSSYGRLQHLRGDPEAAIVTCTAAYQIAQQGGVVVQEQWARIFLGHALLAVGDTGPAEHHYRQAIALHKADNWVYRTADAHAGLAALLLGANKVAAAVVHIEAALDLLAQHGLAGANEPFTVYWTAVRVFTAAEDVRATTILHTAYQHVQTIAAQLTDERLRHAFLEGVAVNHHLLTAAQNAKIG